MNHLIKPVAIATLASSHLLLSGCETLGAIDQQLFKAADSMTERDRITGQRMLSFEDRDSQIKKGNQYVEQFIAQAKKQGRKINEEADPEGYARIKRIFARLHSVSHLGTERWTPILIEDPNWNAFTTGGTYFVIFTALEKDLKDDNELANVIAHEMAHTVANHAFERQSYLQVNALGGSKSASRSSFQSAFTHENEIEADQIGILYCALAGFDPYAGEAIWQRMYQQRGNDGLFVHDHPMNAERAQRARATADKVREYYSPGRENPAFRRLLANNNLFQTDRGSSTGGGDGSGIMALFDTAMNTYGQKQQAKKEEARQAQRIAFMRSVQQAIQIVQSEPVGPNRWRFLVDYRGNRPLTDLAFKTIIHIEPKPVQMFRQVDGVLRPNTRFELIFEAKDFNNAYTTRADQVQLIFDSAKAM